MKAAGPDPHQERARILFRTGWTPVFFSLTRTFGATRGGLIVTGTTADQVIEHVFRLQGRLPRVGPQTCPLCRECGTTTRIR